AGHLFHFGREQGGGHVAQRRLHLSVTSTGRRPCPASRRPSALPTTAPKARARSEAFMAWPAVGELVRRSPGRTAPWAASTLQKTLPTSATGRRPSPARRLSSTSPGL